MLHKDNNKSLLIKSDQEKKEETIYVGKCFFILPIKIL